MVRLLIFVIFCDIGNSNRFDLKTSCFLVNGTISGKLDISWTRELLEHACIRNCSFSWAEYSFVKVSFLHTQFCKLKLHQRNSYVIFLFFLFFYFTAIQKKNFTFVCTRQSARTTCWYFICFINCTGGSRHCKNSKLIETILFRRPKT